MNLLRPGLVRSILAIVVLGVSVPTLGMAFILDALAIQSAAREEKSRLEYGKEYLESLIHDRMGMLSARILQLADDPRLRQALGKPDSALSEALNALSGEYDLASIKAFPVRELPQKQESARFEAFSEGLVFRASAPAESLSGRHWVVEASLVAKRSILEEYRRGIGQDVEIRSFDPSLALDRVELSTRLDPFGQAAIGIRGRTVSGSYLSDLAARSELFGESRMNGRVTVWLDFPLFEGAAGPYVGTVSRSFAHALFAGNRLFVAAVAMAAAGLASLAAIVLAAWFARPIKQLAAGMDGLALRLGTGQEPIYLNETRRDEIGMLALAYNRMAKELKGTRDALATRNREFEEIDRLKDELLAATSHELRTPLAGIMGLAGTMAVDAELPDRFKGVAALVERSSRRLSALVDDILDYTRLRRGELRLKASNFDLSSLIDAVAAACSSQARLGVALMTQAPKPADARGDPDRVVQILRNLVCEALKFTDSGHVEISAARDDGHWRISVRDTGMARERRMGALRSMAIADYADSNMRCLSGGTSLGLAVAIRLIELHGGRFDLETAPDGLGCIARFDLQTAEPDRTAREPRHA